MRGGRNSGVIRGNNKDNVLTGTSADETFKGRRGDDVFYTGGGTDTVTGGQGADTVVIDANTDTIIFTDFENGVDKIDISAFGININDPFGGQYIGYLADVDGDTIITFYDTQNGGAVAAEIILQDFDYTLIDASDYIF